MRQKTIVVGLAFGVLLFTTLSIIAQFMVLSQHRTVQQPSDATAHAANKLSILQFCINHPPEFNVTCNSSMVQNQSYFCQLNATDSDGDGVSFMALFSSTAIFNVTPSGTINFTPTNSDVGNRSMVLFANDDSGCDYATDTEIFNFSVQNINDPPYLIKPIPDQSFRANTTLSAFFLRDYFGDPDLAYGDNLTFTSSHMFGITVTIMPTSEVRFFSSQCGRENIVFTATDTGNLSVSSNEVRVTVECGAAGGSNNSGKGGGGGGGGGPNNLCKSEWSCDEWMQCLPTGYQWQRCTDIRGCEREKYFKRPCLYQGAAPNCAENWLCKEWGKCYVNSTQYRSCRDLENCGTNVTRPPAEQKCVYQPTCDDGIQNGDETGVDCGGELCPSCAIVQQPSLIFGEGGINAWLVTIIILSILLISGIVHYYRSQIAQLMAMLGFMMRHRTYKEVLLDAPQRRSFFERILAFEQLLGTAAGKQMAAPAVYATLASLLRQYVSDALAIHIEALPEEVAARCKELALRPETTTILTGLFAKLTIVEQEELELDMFFVRATLEELRTAVCLTSDYHHDELLRPVEEVPISESMSFYDEIFARAINVLRAIQYDQTEDARKGYMELLTRYDPLSELEKEQIYPELRWLFDMVKFSSDMTGARVVKKLPVAA